MAHNDSVFAWTDIYIYIPNCQHMLFSIWAMIHQAALKKVVDGSMLVEGDVSAQLRFGTMRLSRAERDRIRNGYIGNIGQKVQQFVVDGDLSRYETKRPKVGLVWDRTLVFSCHVFILVEYTVLLTVVICFFHQPIYWQSLHAITSLQNPEPTQTFTEVICLCIWAWNERFSFASDSISYSRRLFRRHQTFCCFMFF